jgi:hypothetical protein
MIFRRRTYSLFVLWPVLFALFLMVWASLSISAHYAAADISASKSHYDLRFGSEHYSVVTQERWPYSFTGSGAVCVWPARAVRVTEMYGGDPSSSSYGSGNKIGLVLPEDAHLVHGALRRPVPEGLALAVRTGEEHLWYTHDLTLSFVWTIVSLLIVMVFMLTARLLVYSLRAHNRELALRCPDCGYPYTAAVGRCPECGHVYTEYERVAAGDVVSGEPS